MKKNDFILIAVIFVIGVTGLLGMKWFQSNDAGAKQVIVKHSGEVIKTFELLPSTNEIFEYNHEKEYNKIVIKDSIVTISEANCKDQICVKTSSIKSNGEIIVCLPHQLTVEIYSKSTEDALDGIAE